MKWIAVIVILGFVIYIIFLDWRSQKKRQKALREIFERVSKRSEFFNKRLSQERKRMENLESAMKDMIEKNEALKKQLKEKQDEESNS